MAQPVPELEQVLEEFRQQWVQEANERKNQPQPAPAVTTSSSDAHPLPLQTRALEAALSDLSLQERTPSSVPTTAVELYETAVRSEREGRLNEALHNYRLAFRADPDVDKTWNRQNAALAKSPPRRHDPLPSTSACAAPTDDSFRYQRTLQVKPDYNVAKEHRSAQAVEAGIGKDALAGTADSTHPSSTAFLRTSLAHSFAANPYISPDSPAPDPSAAPATPEEALASLAFLPADPDRPPPFGTLPHEVLILILKQLCFSSVTPPKAKPVDPVTLLGKGLGKGKHKYKSPGDERRMLELEMGLEEPEVGWRTDVEALERFARTCRAARILTLDETIWRELCMRTYLPPHQIEVDESAAQLTRDQHGGDFRRCYIEHPRIRLDGAFISLVTYVRRGDSSQAWYAPTHLITFYRYLRFYPTGLVVSLLTTDQPNAVVRTLNPSLRTKGVTLGRWCLRGDIVDCWGLEDPNVVAAARKYSFRMVCRLKSTARGKMNKLEMLSLATENRATLDVEDVPIRPTKPFFFSKVAAYAGED